MARPRLGLGASLGLRRGARANPVGVVVVVTLVIVARIKYYEYKVSLSSRHRCLSAAPHLALSRVARPRALRALLASLRPPLAVLFLFGST